ncbi:CRISPR-associated endonuclease Cas3'' [Acidithiobacillus ferrivorans]|uniref:CRISPR-associated endonuclease Cas3 n=1 Tax=Acidithiobacillus ferrivorans TaxID=160808 RepID=A0A7T4WGF4_9PROT|nr:CRISPR-associated endonuclease Cas3'' [Acidithiobacillus ferrivorans]QQD73987.1 CRISPR-associated endonuclease Cas3'' [Acidithiobacillus ferrivorans]
MHCALRRQATRQTSVACYRSDATFGLRLIWVVGNQSSYDKRGWFAVATRQRKRLFPMAFRHAALIAHLAGYAHDLGKASRHFQDKLRQSAAESPGKDSSNRHGDYIRHEWLSAWLLHHLDEIGADFSLEGLNNAWTVMQCKEGKASGPTLPNHLSVGTLESALSAVLFGVCTHHGAFGGDFGALNGDAHIDVYGRRNSDRSKTPDLLAIATKIDPSGEDGKRWQQVMQGMDQLRKRVSSIERPRAYWEGVMLVARAALIFADHKISSQIFPGSREDGVLFANTKKNVMETGIQSKKRKASRKKKEPERYLDQPLSWHLLQVGDLAAQNVRMFTGDGMPTLSPEICEQLMHTRAAPDSRFAWQDNASDAMRVEGGKLVFNVASTGAGKTLANLKMAVAARHSRDVRVAVAFNLRSLTTQTFSAFQEHIGALDTALFQRDFACLIGDRGASRVDFSLEDEDDIDEVAPIDLIGADALEIPEWLNHIAGTGPEDKSMVHLLASPVLVSTMDWIVASGEPGQQDRHAKAMIRVCTSDLILDEVDSYDVKAAVAVMRVVETAASFGRNVIVSSATLNPALAEGIAAAFAAGRKTYEAMFGVESWAILVVSDLLPPQSIAAPGRKNAAQFYGDTLRAMTKAIAQKPVTKRYQIAEIHEEGLAEERFSNTIIQSAWSLHQQHAMHYPGLHQDCRLSIGLVRVANVKPCMDVSDLLQKDGRFVVSAYHARDVIERRAWKEAHLDRVLSRKPGNDKWLTALLNLEPWLRDAAGDVCLVMVATPVEEVGRDHDFDWAIIEPSSMHSIVQTAGRVNRHRRNALPEGRINVVILDRNLKSIQDDQREVFDRPGLEFRDAAGGAFTHPHHDMQNLLTPEGGDPQDVLDAGMVFDVGSRKTLFASCDEDAVKMKIETILSSIERDAGHETDFMLKKYATDYPLRSGDQDRIISIDLHQKAFSWDPDKNKAGNFYALSRPDRTWATVDLEDIQFLKDDPIDLRAPIESGVSPTQVHAYWNGLVFDER